MGKGVTQFYFLNWLMNELSSNQKKFLERLSCL